MNCNETLFDVITSIESYDFTGESTMKTMNVHTKNVNEQEIMLELKTETIKVIRPKAKSCSYSEKKSTGIAGDFYEVTISWSLQPERNVIFEKLESLYEYPKHLILRTYSGVGYFIRCEEEGYQFSYIEKDGLIECEATFHNKNGIQRIL